MDGGFEDAGTLDYANRARSYSWSHGPRPTGLGKWAMVPSFVEDGVKQEHNDEYVLQCGDKRAISNEQTALTKKRRKSYTEIIATAILSSPEKRLTLAEIYDWMAANVDEYKDQRYVPSSCSWKNAVRHNLSVQSCFKRVKRHGVEKPSWWTVDVRQVAKRRLSVQPTSGMKMEMDTTEFSNASQIRSQTLPMVMANDGMGALKGIDNFDQAINGLVDNLENMGQGEHAYSRNVQLIAAPAGHLTTMNSINTSNTNPQCTVAILEAGTSLVVNGNAEELTQAWLNQYKVSKLQTLTDTDMDRCMQMLRVKTSHGAEQNVRFVGPLRLNVVVRCDRSVQTDTADTMDMGMDKQTSLTTTSCLPSLSRFCSIDSHSDQTFMNLGTDHNCDVSRVCSNDVKMTTAENVLSPTLIFEDDPFPASWNSAVNSNTNDIMTLSNGL